jgi:signal transduction histidine kinase
VDGQPIAEIPPRPRWPITKLIALVDALGARERQYGRLRQQMRTHTEQTAVQKEPNRLARDRHDSIKQQLFSINVQAAAAQARWEHDPQAAQGAIADVRRSAHEALVEMRALLQQFRPAPLETVGLIESLRDQCEALDYRSGAHVAPHFGALPGDDQLPPGAQEAIFRIAQEALGNVARQARAEHVALQCSTTCMRCGSIRKRCTTA